MDKVDYLLVSAPNAVGEAFIRLLQSKKIPFAVIVNNKEEFKRMTSLGIDRIVLINTSDEDTWIKPDIRIGKMFFFERSLNLCCRYLQICRSWTRKPIYVVTGSHNPRLVYKGLGAHFVLHTNNNDVSFLITDEL